jgi:hypothetical protein
MGRFAVGKKPLLAEDAPRTGPLIPSIEYASQACQRISIQSNQQARVLSLLCPLHMSKSVLHEMGIVARVLRFDNNQIAARLIKWEFRIKWG